MYTNVVVQQALERNRFGQAPSDILPKERFCCVVIIFQFFHLKVLTYLLSIGYMSIYDVRDVIFQILPRLRSSVWNLASTDSNLQVPLLNSWKRTQHNCSFLFFDYLCRIRRAEFWGQEFRELLRLYSSLCDTLRVCTGINVGMRDLVLC